MFVYKKLQPSDVSITPFEAHKQFNYVSSSAGNNGIIFKTTRWTSESKANYSVNNLAGNFKNHRDYFQLDRIFFRDYILNNGNLIPDVNYIDQERRVYDKINVLSIPQNQFGSRIEPLSLEISGTFNIGGDVTRGITILDDGEGNIYPNSYTLGSTNWPTEEERRLYIGPVKGFKKKDLKVDNHTNQPLVNTSDTFTLNNIYDDSYHLNQVDYNKITFTGESPLTFIDTGESGYLRVGHNNDLNFSFNDDFNISFYFKTTQNDSLRVSGSAGNNQYYFIAKSDVKTVVPSPGEGQSEILSLLTSGNLQSIDVPAENQYPYKVYYSDNLEDTGSLFFARSNGEVTSTISASLFNSGSVEEIIHVSVQKTGSELQIFKNGIKVSSGSDINPSVCKNIPPINQANLYIGSRGAIDSYLNSNVSQIMVFSKALSSTQISNVSQSITGTPFIGNIFYDEGFITLNHPSYTNTIFNQYSASSETITLSPTLGTKDNHDIALFNATENIFIIKNIGDRIEQPSSSTPLTNRTFVGEPGFHQNFVAFFNESIINNFNPTALVGVNSTTIENGLQADNFYKFSPKTVTSFGNITLNPVNEVTERRDFMTGGISVTFDINSSSIQPFTPSGSASIGPGNFPSTAAPYAFISSAANIVNQAVTINFASASDNTLTNDSFAHGSDSSLTNTPFRAGSITIGGVPQQNLTNFNGAYADIAVNGLTMKATAGSSGVYYLGRLYGVLGGANVSLTPGIYKGGRFNYAIQDLPFGATDGASFGGIEGTGFVSPSVRDIEILAVPPQGLSVSGNPFQIEVTGSLISFDPLIADGSDPRVPVGTEENASVCVAIEKDQGGSGVFSIHREILISESLSAGQQFRAIFRNPDGNLTPQAQVGAEPQVGDKYRVSVKVTNVSSSASPVVRVSDFGITGPTPEGNLFDNALVISSSITTKRSASYDITLNNLNPGPPGPADNNLLGLVEDENGNPLGIRVNLYKDIVGDGSNIGGGTLITSSFFVSGSDFNTNDFNFQHLTSGDEDEILNLYVMASNETNSGSVNVALSQSFSISGSFTVIEKSGSNVLTLNTSLPAAYGSSSYEPEIIFNSPLDPSSTPLTGSISSSLISPITSINGNTAIVSDNYLIVESAYNIIGSGSVTAIARYKLNNEISASTTINVGTSSLFTVENLFLGTGSGTSPSSFSSSLTNHNPAPRLRIFSGSQLIRTLTGSNGRLLIQNEHLGLINSGTALGFEVDVIDTASIGIEFTSSTAAITSSNGEGFSLDNFSIKGLTASLSASTSDTFVEEGTHIQFISTHNSGSEIFKFTSGSTTASYTFVDSQNVILGGALFTTESQTVEVIASSSTGFPIELNWTASLNSSSIIRFRSSSLPASNSLKNVIKTFGETDANKGLSFFIEDPFGVTIATSSFINSASYSGSENFTIPEVTASVAGTYVFSLKTTNSASAVIPVDFSIGISSNMTSSILGGDQTTPGQNTQGHPNPAINGGLMYISNLSASYLSSVIKPDNTTNLSLLSLGAYNEPGAGGPSAVIIHNPHNTSSGAHNLFTTVSQSGELLKVPARVDTETKSEDLTDANFEFSLLSGSTKTLLFITGGCSITASKGFTDFFVASTTQSATSLPVPLLEGNFIYGNDGFDLLTVNGNDFTINQPLLLSGSTNITLNYNSTASHDYTLKFKNTHLIFENEYQCSVDEEEYNFTQNVSVKKNKSIGDPNLVDCITSSLDNSQITLFKPYVTTVGLYDDDYNLLAVGKFAQPIKMSEETDMTFVIRYDT